MNISADVLITGLPRSGTTMTCHLLNKIQNHVALHEPLNVGKLATLPHSEIVEEIRIFFADQRHMVRTEGRAKSKSWKGGIPTNTRSEPDASGERRHLIDGKEIDVRNVDRDDFHLYIKHPAFFTAALPVLTEYFPCFAIMRNPLSVLLSWRASGMAVAHGRMPVAELFDLGLAETLSGLETPLKRQLALLDYCFLQYQTYLPGRVVKYEDVIDSGGKALTTISPAASELGEVLKSRNQIRLINDPEALAISRALLDHESPCWDFYSRDDVRSLCATPA